MAMSGRFWKVRSSYRRSRQQTSKIDKCGESLRQCDGRGRADKQKTKRRHATGRQSSRRIRLTEKEAAILRFFY